MHRALSCLALGGLASLAACGSGDGTLERRAELVNHTPRQARVQATPSQRFGGMGGMGMGIQPGTGDGGTQAAGAAPPQFAYRLPDTWEELETSALRLVNLRPAGDPEVECYLTGLRGSGGGLAGNVNRWRAQMGLDPLDLTAIAGLPTRTLLGKKATYLELEGSFKGMGDEGRAGYKMLGLIIPGGEFTIFLKMTGPAPMVDGEKGRFEEFLASLRLDDGHDHDHDRAEAAPQAAPPVATGGGARIRWSTPEGWTEDPGRPMREVSFRVGQGTECYVSLLGGDGGGMVANLNRWSRQVGGEGLTPAELAALPRVTVLGQDSPLLEVHGTFTGMGGEPQADHTLLGIACMRDGGATFVKMIGPAAEVAAEREHFLAFARSLKD